MYPGPWLADTCRYGMQFLGDYGMQERDPSFPEGGGMGILGVRSHQQVLDVLDVQSNYFRRVEVDGIAKVSRMLIRHRIGGESLLGFFSLELTSTAGIWYRLYQGYAARACG